MVILRRILLFLCYLSTNIVNAQGGVEYEFSMGLSTTKASILSYEIGLVGNDRPYVRSPLGYRLSVGVNSKPAVIQMGLNLWHDHQSFNIYEKVRFPEDHDSPTSSRWNHTYLADRIGIEGHLRANIQQLFFQAGLATSATITANTNHEFYYAFSDSREEAEGGEYTKPGKLAGTFAIGFPHNTNENSSFMFMAGMKYSFYNQEYSDIEYLRYWKIRPVDLYFTAVYRIFRPCNC